MRTSLELAANLASQSVSLPAVATCTWCQSAAQALSIARPKCLALVRFLDERSGATLDAPWPHTGISSRPENKPLVEAVRAAAEQEVTLPTEIESDQELAGASPEGAWAIQLEQNEEESDPAVSILSFVGARSALVASSVIDQPNGALLRVVIAESAFNDEPPFTSQDAEALQAAMSRIAHRARVAFVPESGEGFSPLNEREVTVLESLARGKTIREIAASMHRSTHTIHDYLKSMHRKIGVANRAELIARAAGRCGPRTSQELEIRVPDAGDRASLTRTQ